MERVVRLHRKLAPDLVALFRERYHILRHIRYSQPIGRRALAAALGMGERVVRAEVDFLKDNGLVNYSSVGMVITPEGQEVLDDLAEYVRLLCGLTDLEHYLAKRLGLKQVIIIPGDSSADKSVETDLGRAAAGVLKRHLGNNMIIAVSGGSTMARVAEAVSGGAPTAVVVPARGGLGERVEFQANTIAAGMAAKLGGRYRLLHIPDGMGEEALELLLADANIRAVAEMIKQADILIHGIGRADTMAIRRGMGEDAVAAIISRGAVGEALGHYCTLDGRIVHVTSSIGLHLDDLSGVGLVIAAAGGESKAEAIVAVATAGRQDILVTDEAAAKAINRILNKN